MTLDTFRQKIPKYIKWLVELEMSHNTIRKYSLALQTFITFAEEANYYEDICKDHFVVYKEYLKKKYRPNTVNLYIVAINKYLHYIGEDGLRIKALKIQSHNSLDNCLTTAEYQLMLDVAKKRKDSTAYYVMRALASTGVRFSTLEYFTVNILISGICTITNKGKTRAIVIPIAVCEELKEYCEKKKIERGYIFRARDPGKPVNEPTVLRWLKKIAEQAGVDPRKAFPHNLRHLFARTYIEVHNNIGELADLLGHTKIETTRIYTRTSLEEKRRNLELLGL